MKHSFVRKLNMIIVICIILLSCGIDVSSMETYKELAIRIPFDYIDSSDHGDDCTVKIEYDAGMPKPDTDTKTLKNGTNDYFTIKVNAPGIYKYKVYEVPGSKDSIFYDDTIYSITIYVTNTDVPDELTHTITVESSKTGAKPKKLEFKNKNAGSDRDLPDDNPPADPGSGSTPADGNKSSSSKSLLTGDNAPIAIMILICVAAFVLSIITFIKKRKVAKIFEEQ